MSDGSGASLQKAIYAALAADAGLQALIGSPARLYDDVPQDTVFPYVTIGDVVSADWSTGSGSGIEHRLLLHAWSRHGGRSEVHAILAALYARLHLAPLALEGHRLVLLRLEFAQVLREEDGETYHGLHRYRALTEPDN